MILLPLPMLPYAFVQEDSMCFASAASNSNAIPTPKGWLHVSKLAPVIKKQTT